MTSNADPTGVVCIVESITGTWHYHIAQVGMEQSALCGKATMSSNAPWRTWGLKSHLHESYCDNCVKFMAKNWAEVRKTR